MPRQTAKPELEWKTATIEQVADLRVWVSARSVPQRHVQGICEWMFTLSEPKASQPEKRHLKLYRRLLAAYGPPRPAAAALNVDETHAAVTEELAEMADRHHGQDVRPVDDLPQPIRPAHPGQASGAVDPADGTRRRFHRA